MLTHQELKDLSQVSGLRSTLQIIFDWAILLSIYSYNLFYPNPFLIALSLPFMARQQMALLVLLHDGSHMRLYHRPKINDFVTQFFMGSPVFFSLRLYRKTHLKHHRHPLEPDDPDLNLTGGYPVPAKSFRRKILRDLSGISYFKFMAHFIRFKKAGHKKVSSEPAHAEKNENFFVSDPFIYGAGLVVNGGLFALAWYAGRPLLYFVLWWLPLITILQLYLRIRGITEHAGYQPGQDQKALSRTVINPVETFFFSPNSVNYHIEHHAYPSVPFHNLHKVHWLMSERGSLPKANVYKTYRDVVKELVREK
jgi:fatty acid desaturase